MSSVTNTTPSTERNPVDNWWGNEECETLRFHFSQRLRSCLFSDPRVARLRTLLSQWDFDIRGGFFAVEGTSKLSPLDFFPAAIEEMLSDVYRDGDAPGETTTLTVQELALATETYAVFTDLATHYLTVFAEAQTDLVAPISILTPMLLADVLLLPFRIGLMFIVCDRITMNDEVKVEFGVA